MTITLINSLKPKGFIIFASCDNEYLKQHAPSFVISVAKAGNTPHVHIIDPEEDGIKIIYNVQKYVKNKYNCELSITVEYSHIKSKYSPEQARVYYACNRFLIAPKLMESFPDITSILVSDIDSLIMQNIPEPEYKLGLFLRDSLPGTVGWEQEGTRVAAGIFFFKRGIYQFFAEQVARNIWSNINEGNMRWFLDQICLSRTYVNHIGKYPNFHNFTPEEMDWEFKEGTMVWTGKGSRKYDNPIYVAKKKEFEDECKS